MAQAVGLLPVFAVLVLPSLGTAQVVYDNFTADGSFFRIGWSVIGASSGQPLEIVQGDGFVSQATGRIGSLTVAMGHADGENAVWFRLFEEADGIVGGKVGEPVLGQTSPGSAGLPTAKIHVDVSEAHWDVRQGGDYWLVAEGTAESGHAWQLNLVGDSGRHLVLDSRQGVPEYSTATHGAFRLDLVHEPGTWPLLGLPTWIALRRRR